MDTIKISPGKNNVGAYINDINLNLLNKDLIEQIKNILKKFGVIFIKKQNIDSNAYQAFAESIGQLVEYPRLKGLENFPYINVLERKPTDKSLAFGGSWLHQDTSYLEKDRPRFTCLLGIEIPKGQGNTIFSSGFNAYKKLPDEIKQKIKNAKGIFSSAGPISKTRIELEKRAGIQSSKVMEAEHPIVQEVNGQKSLYVSPGHLIKIKDVIDADSDKIKKFLLDHVNKDEFIFSYEWSKGDLVLWDNLSIMHKASEIKNCTRIMHRITIK
jgi:alpha-ketoglutarate-dependent taurine dioxygenase